MDKIAMLERLQTHLDEVKAAHPTPRFEANKEWVSQICSLLGIPKEGAEMCAQILTHKPPTNLVWLHMAECTGCSESLLRLDKPGLESLIFECISIEYHETIMGAVGFGAKKSLHDGLKKDFILVIEGGVSLGENAYFLTSGAESITGEMECKEAAEQAQAIFAIGTCSSFGGVQAAYPNPTHAKGISSLLKQRVINIPGCPPSETNIIGSLMYYILLKTLPPCDELNRPLWSYGKNLHDLCERRARFEAGDFAQSFDDERLQDGYCLYKVGCKGPYVSNNCPKVKFNAKTSWPVRAGHGCIACSEPDFWDSFGHIEEPLNNANAYITTPKTFKTLPFIHDMNDDLSTETLCLELDTHLPTRIYKTEGENLLHCSFSAHLPILLQNLRGRNKLGARLVENYEQWRKMQPHIESVDSINHAQAEISHNMSDILKLIGEMFGERKPCALDTLKAAQSYLFAHVSKLDI
ncbi:hydrogenase small subunit [Helicobacter jaachi]|uniref:hydrogenase small subunit n=1 Tax=Helicobacter jaachi TaxID=1677920 RepID=UPI000A8B21AF|nr:hydrogenase small subunit [Helicobacter jaachi]